MCSQFPFGATCKATPARNLIGGAAANKDPGNLFIHSHDESWRCMLGALPSSDRPHNILDYISPENEQHLSASPMSPIPMAPTGGMLGNLPTQKDPMQGWDNYPTSLPRHLHSTEDVDDLREQLEQKSKNLFTSEPHKDQLEVWVEGAEETVDNSTSLEKFLTVGDGVEDGRTKFFFMTRRNSWTKIKVSFKMFKMLCHFYRIFPKYLETVFQFDVETCRKEEYFSSGCHRYVHNDDDRGSTIFEISYNVRHFEKHSRPELDDPWSCRQFSAYQKYSFSNNSSTWILIQIPVGTRRYLERYGSEAGSLSPYDHPLAIHLHLLRSCEKNWGPYVSYLSDELSSMNKHISFPKQFGEYKLGVSHIQSLAQLRAKLQNAESLLEFNVDVASILSEHAKEMNTKRVCLAETNRRFQSEISQYKRRQKCHVRNVKKHLAFSEDIRVQILKIMDFRNDELLRANGVSLKELADKSAQENEAMLGIARRTKADSRAMKTASLIATICLPLTAVTSFCSTGFIQYNKKPGSEQATNITFRKEVWVFILVVVVTMAFTWAVAYYWVRRRKKADQKDSPV